MRTLIVTQLFPPSFGGVQSFYLNIARHFSDNDVVVLADESEDSSAFDRVLPFRIYRRPIGRITNRVRPWLALELVWCIWELWIIVRREKIEHVIVGQARNVVLVLAGIIIGRILGIPITLFGHGEDVAGILSSRLKSNSVLKYLYKYCDHFIANSTFTGEMWKRLGIGADRIHILHPCVDPDLFCIIPDGIRLKEKYKLAGKTVLLTVGRLDLRKGHDTVIRALPIFKQRFPNIVYLVVGDGEAKPYLSELAERYKVVSEVLFWGRVAPETMRECLNLCDLFVMPNREVEGGDVEGFGTVFLEANSCGKPVIGGRSGGTIDAIEDGKSGFLCDPNSIDDFVEKTSLLLSDTELAGRIGEYGRHRTMTQFSCKKRIPEFFSQFPNCPKDRISGDVTRSLRDIV